MATRKAVSKTKKTVARKTTKAVSKKKVAKKGDKYVCGVCGMVVSVDTACGCMDDCDIVCCGEAMTQKKGRKNG